MCARQSLHALPSFGFLFEQTTGAKIAPVLFDFDYAKVTSSRRATSVIISLRSASVFHSISP